MGWLKDLTRYRDERHELIQLTHQLERLSAEFREKTSNLKARSDEYQKLLAQFGNEADFVTARIAEIETDQMLRRAYFWRIPLPRRPFKEAEDDSFWEWNSAHGRYYLSDAAMSTIRKEAYQEWEMATKPWLSWAAIFISIISLAVAALKP